MTLDDYTMTGDTQVLEDYGLPICSTVLEFFRTRFPRIDNTTGKTDMWPAQARWEMGEPKGALWEPRITQRFGKPGNAKGAQGWHL